jgi:hypothetical protein
MSGRRWALTDRLDSRSFERDGDDLTAAGLYVALDPWACHFLSFAT